MTLEVFSNLNNSVILCNPPNNQQKTPREHFITYALDTLLTRKNFHQQNQ